VNTAKNIRIQQSVSVRTASELLQIFWPDFVDVDGCIFARFQCSGGPINELSEGKTETECFINHTHVLDEFHNDATSAHRDAVSEDFEVVEETYDPAHPDFVTACEIGRQMARLWAMKLKSEFPNERFRVYYTQYDNPIVRFHKVRINEPVWLTNEQLRDAADPSFRNAVIYDTDDIDNPVVKKPVTPN
jgi:hypothetical protein